MSRDLEVLRRWETSGAAWQVLDRGQVHLEIALLTCDAGEQVGRLVSAEPDLREHVGERMRSDEV
jgi:hypothetical protein